MLLVYLVLAAQYESWVLPFIILLGVPLAVFGALGAQFCAASPTTSSVRSGWCMLVGLAAKNSILIVEFAEQLRDAGHVDHRRGGRGGAHPAAADPDDVDRVHPRRAAAGLRHRRRRRRAQSVGTTVAGGMLASTFLSIVFIPVLYVIIRTLVPGKPRQATSVEVPAAAPAMAAHE